MFRGADDDVLVVNAPVRPNINQPRWDQETYFGRAKHFFSTVNPVNCLISTKRLEESRRIVLEYREGKVDPKLTVKELWKAKEAFDSAYHPETGEKMMILGRMSSQVPCNMILNGGMLTFRSSFAAVVSWHWLNQSFNAVVNYTNRSGEGTSNERLLASYFCATTSAVTSALYLNSLVKNTAGFWARMVPFVAVSIANAINIPMMRSKELTEGVLLTDKDGREVGHSRLAAVLGIGQVTFSRIAMAASTTIVTPSLMMLIEKRKWFMRRTWLAAPIQTVIAGFTLTFTTPLACAFFPQKSAIEVRKLEKHVQQKIAAFPNPPTVVYYNKGL